MNDLFEKKRLQAALKRAEANVCDIELKILAKEEEIIRIEKEIENIKIMLLERQSEVSRLQQQLISLEGGHNE